MDLPDTLSRAYLPEQSHLKQVNTIDFMSITDDKYQELQDRNLMEVSKLQDFILNGWPHTKRGLPPVVRPFWDSIEAN